ncbi:hypothetical protein [Isoptericola sp. AK164]|uniref:hypothetical protein n=1 Tax=Isoptericola sp. AK164 TaxID=3024246 RepID=UPI00241893E6|nr:hypothetical protein [Isoptericola sp. AK164]
MTTTPAARPATAVVQRRLTDGKAYDPADTTHLRMNFACPRSRLDDGLARLRRAVQELPDVPSG